MTEMRSPGLFPLVILVASGLVSRAVAQSNNNIFFELLEEQKADTFVGNVAQVSGITAEVAHADIPNVRYQILSSDGLRISSMFTINIRSGMLYTNAMIDREQVCDSTVITCKLEFDVTVKLDVAVLKILHVVIIIQDINDNSPSFPVKVLHQNLSEASPKESDFSVPSAMDRDAQTSTSIMYWIETNQIFGLKEEKLLGVSLLKVILLQDLDREKQSEYKLHIFAKDGNTSSALTGTLSVIISVTDANDNIPQFTESIFNFTVSEDAPIGSWVGTVNATDLDEGENGRITFQFSSFAPNKVRQLFDLNLDTGKVTVKAELQYESDETFQAVIVAKDNGESPKVSQGIMIINIIDVGNTPPKLSLILVDPLNQNSAILSEELPVDWFVGTLRYQDKDKGENGLVDCTSMNPHFTLEPLEESGYAIEIKLQLDREAEPEMLVVLSCSDHGTPSLSAHVNFTVRVSDVNDNRPVFEEPEYNISVKEGQLSHQNLLRVSASDADEGANKEVIYQLTTNTSNSFSIDPATGWISLISSVDRETEPIIRLNVEAVDRGQQPFTGYVTVIIFVEDVNDNKPEITRTQYQVKENQEPGTFVAQIIASDADDGVNSELTFHLVSDQSVGFQVTESGAITTTAIFDRESLDYYVIVVSVRDKGIPSLTSNSTLTIEITDTNDHTPLVFYPRPGNDTVFASANLPPGAIIAKINASDSDLDKNAKLVYLIAEGYPQMFGIDNVTGTIFLIKRLTSSRDTSYRLTISVQDGGSPRLHSNTFLYINVDFTNVTVTDASSDMEQKYVIITGVIAGLTLIIASIVISIIVILRRNEPDRCLESGLKSKNISHGHSGAKVLSDVNILEVSTFKVDEMNKEFGGDHDKDRSYDANISFDSNLTNGSVPASHRPSLTRDLLDRQISGPLSLYLEGRQRLASEDINSDTSADATASDSGRGASDCEDVSSGASLPPPYYPDATLAKFTALRVPLTDVGQIVHANDRRIMALTFSPNSSTSDLSRTPLDHSPQNDFDKIRTPSKVRFVIDNHNMGNQRHHKSHTPFAHQTANTDHPTRPYLDVTRGHRTGLPRQNGGQCLSDKTANQSTHVNSNEQGQFNTASRVPLSMDALAKHNRLQTGSKQQPTPNTQRFAIPHCNHHYQQQHGALGVVSQSDDDDDGSTTTSGSYMIDGSDDTIRASVDC